MMRAILALALIAALGLPAAAAVDKYPATTMIENVPAQVDPSAALAGVQIMLPGGLDRQGGQQNGFAALLAEVIAQTPVPGGERPLPLRSAISASGANLTVSVEPQYVRYYVEGSPTTIRAALALLGGALAAPDFSHATISRARKTLASRIIDANESPFGVLSEMLRRSYYAGSGAGYAPLGSLSVVSNAGSVALKKFWSDNYRSGGATIAAAGRVDADVARAAQAVVARLPAGSPASLTQKTLAPTDPPTRIVTHRDVALPWVGVGFAAPTPGAKDFASMLVVQAIVSTLGQTDSIVSRPALFRPINAIYQYEVKPANFIIYASGTGIGTSAGWREIFQATDVLAAKQLDASVIERYRTLARGQFVIDNMTLEDRSALVGWVARMGLDPDYPNSVLDAIDAVTPSDVQRVVKEYLQKYTFALVLPRTQEQH
ncbi:MAG TPA: insulinase family protein [Candidatus Baltobacteraceae bacterium]|jgi:predicted Zn-dependent peptidase